MDDVYYRAAGPIIEKFHFDPSFVRGIRGSVGSGKTVGACFEIFNKACTQKAHRNVRYSRWALIRNCFDAKTEILTESRGWQFFKNLQPDDKVATLKDDKLTFEIPSHYYSAPYSGEMTRIKQEGIDLLVTPDHRLYVSTRRTRKKVWSDYEIVGADKIYGKSLRRMKRDAGWEGVHPGLPEGFFEFLGFWYAEGYAGVYDRSDCNGKHYRLVVTHNEDEYVENLLKINGFKYGKCFKDGGKCANYTIKISKKNKKLIEELSKYGKSTSKWVPQYIKDAPRGHLRAFIKGFQYGDGSCRSRGEHKSTHLYTSSKQLADDLQEMSLKAGYVANLNTQYNNYSPVYNMTAPCNTLTLLTEKKYHPVMLPRHWSKEQYDDMVYCVEVSTHVVYVRRNGRAVWSSQTHSELRDTTLKTWMDWFGSCSKVKQTAPMRGKFLWTNPMDGTVIDLELWFIALDKPKDVRRMKSLELTGAFMNEAVEMPKSVLDKATERVRRYPGNRKGGITWSGVIMDTNSCDDDHWWYELFEEDIPEGYAVFNQPSALLRFPDEPTMQAYLNKNPDYPHERRSVKDHKNRYYIVNSVCENVDGQPAGGDYWLDLVHGKDSRYIEVFLMNQFGTITDSRPVYPEYIDEWHCPPKEIKPEPNIGITLGFDFGNTPACSLSQILPSGQKVWFDEFYVKEHAGMGIRKFSREVLVPELLDNYLPWLQKKLINGFGDPAGRTPVQTDEKTCFMILRECLLTEGPDGIDYHANALKLHDKEWVELLRYKAIEGEVSIGDLGVEVGPARTNNLIPRIDAVSKWLIAKIDDGPAFQISKKCKLARKGFRGKYRYQRVQVSGDARYHDIPLKSLESHLMDGFQADCLESEYQAHNVSKEEEERQAKELRERIGNTSAAMWDEVEQMKDDLDAEYDAINDAYWEDY